MPDGGRAGTGGADFDISIARESKVKPTMRPLKMGPKNGKPFRSLPLTGFDMIVRLVNIPHAELRTEHTGVSAAPLERRRDRFREGKQRLG